MTDVLLDADGDLAWSQDGLISTVDGDEEILQRVWIALSTGLGEWAFDVAFGFPYRRFLAGRGVDRVMVEGAVRATVEPITGAGSIRAIQIDHDPQAKLLTITVDTIYGVVEVTA